MFSKEFEQQPKQSVERKSQTTPETAQQARPQQADPRPAPSDGQPSGAAFSEMVDSLSQQQGIASSGQSGSPGKLPHLNILESAFGRPLGDIPTFTDPQANRAADTLNADAYQYRGGVVLGSGASLRHEAEEVAHVVQRGVGGGFGGMTSPGSSVEMEASRVADSVMSGGIAGPISGGLGDTAIARATKKPSAPVAAGQVRGNCTIEGKKSQEQGLKVVDKSFPHRNHTWAVDETTGRVRDPTLKDNLEEYRPKDPKHPLCRQLDAVPTKEWYSKAEHAAHEALMRRLQQHFMDTDPVEQQIEHQSGSIADFDPFGGASVQMGGLPPKPSKPKKSKSRSAAKPRPKKKKKKKK